MSIRGKINSGILFLRRKEDRKHGVKKEGGGRKGREAGRKELI